MFCRDRWGLKILNNLEPEREVERRVRVEERGYHYQAGATCSGFSPEHK
jgi:hypothetical protein